MVVQGLMIAQAAAGQDSGIAVGSHRGSEARTEKPGIKSGTNTE